jgi:hypothetical protein
MSRLTGAANSDFEILTNDWFVEMASNLPVIALLREPHFSDDPMVPLNRQPKY